MLLRSSPRTGTDVLRVRTSMTQKRVHLNPPASFPLPKILSFSFLLSLFSLYLFSTSLSSLVSQSPSPLRHLHSNLRPPSLSLSLSGEETVAIKRVCWGLGVWRTTVTLCDPAFVPRRTNERDQPPPPPPPLSPLPPLPSCQTPGR